LSTRAPVRIVGGYISPYVRKVLVALDLKGIPYEIDPIVPFFGDDRFSAMSPLRRIPVLIDDSVTLCDSTVICEYLDDRHPERPLHPSTAADRARARWLEEYADSRMGDVFIWQLFNQVVIRPFVWGIETDRVALAETLDVEIPQVLDYLEKELPAEGYLFGNVPMIADVSIAAFFRNAAFAGFRPDATHHPRTAAFVGRMLAEKPFTNLAPFEDALLRRAPVEHRRVLLEMGAPVTEDTVATAEPRRGPMRT